MEATTHSASPRPAPGARRALAVSSAYTDGEMVQQIGREAYSYRFVYKAFASLLERWGRVVEVTRPESRLDYALWRFRQENLEPIHLSFLPLHLTYLTARAPNVVFPFWEFPDLPDRNFNHNLRNNWVHIADRLALILTACTFTRDAFLRAGVKTPVRVVPVPVPDAYFRVPPWETDQRIVLDCPACVFPLPEAPSPAAPNPWVPARPATLSLKARARGLYKGYIKPRLGARFDRYLTIAYRTARGIKSEPPREQIRFPISSSLELSGVVYTTILNPFDPRKNWQDTLTAYLLALADCEDATLVLKLVVCPELAPQAVNGVAGFYQHLGIRHRCKLAIVAEYLSDSQMVELAQASTYYINSARAEGACLPLQNFLAASRPGVAPAHTAMADYFREDLGFVVAAHPEPAAWPHDPEQRTTTRWNRIVWQSLHDQLRASYEVAKQNRGRYQALAVHGRERMLEFASAERIWPRLVAGLCLVDPVRNTGEPSLPMRMAS
jgi:hypothetical protein